MFFFPLPAFRYLNPFSRDPTRSASSSYCGAAIQFLGTHVLNRGGRGVRSPTDALVPIMMRDNPVINHYNSTCDEQRPAR